MFTEFGPAIVLSGLESPFRGDDGVHCGGGGGGSREDGHGGEGDEGLEGEHLGDPSVCFLW